MGFLHRRVLLGLLHGFAEALLFVRGEWDREARVRASLRAGAVGTERGAGGFFGGEAEAGGEEEQG
jgi:hypothetical protein